MRQRARNRLRRVLLPTLLAACPPLAAGDAFTAGDRARHYLHRTYSWQRGALLGLDTGFEHLTGGGGDYGSRYGRAFARRVSRNTMEYGLGALLDEDARYSPSGERAFHRRLRHAALRTLFHPEDGRYRPTWSRIVPALANGVAASAWEGRPPGPGSAAANFGWTLAGDLQTRCLDEFSPDLKRFGRRVARVLLRRPRALAD